MQDYNDWLIDREESIEYKKQVNTDTTYCTSEKCKNKCWRHISNYKFNEKENYWFMSNCEKE